MASKRRRKKTAKGRSKSQINHDYLVQKGEEFSKDLRTRATKWEKIMYKHLKDLHYKFKFQVPIICNRNHLYIADFVLQDSNLIIEVDGVTNHGTREAIKKDRLRTRRLKKEGYEVMRFWNLQVSVYSKETIDDIIRTRLELLKKAKEVQKEKAQ